MRTATARRIASTTTESETAKWARGIYEFADSAHKELFKAMRNTCDTCPFRSSASLGGCVSDDCPVFAVWDGFTKATKRTMTAMREISNSRYSYAG